MSKILAGVNAGMKNIVLGIVMFFILGVVAGVPLTVNLFGGSMLTESQYQSWKILHAYGVFSAFINFFFGFLVDRMETRKRQQEIASWLFVLAGFIGGFGRPLLFVFSVPGLTGGYIVSAIETVGFVVGTFIFIRSLINKRPA